VMDEDRRISRVLCGDARDGEAGHGEKDPSHQPRQPCKRPAPLLPAIDRSYPPCTSLNITHP
jgi:hypothetical protein